MITGPRRRRQSPRVRALLGCAILLAALAQGANRPATAAQSPTAVDVCALEGLVAYGTAREAIVARRKKTYWRWQPETSDFQYALLDALYDRIESQGFKDHPLFGAERLVACLHRSMPGEVQPEPARFSPCFAQMDVVLHARQYKAGGGGLAGTKRYARNYLKDPAVYPQAMLDRLLPIAFAADDPAALTALRERLLHDCIEAQRRPARQGPTITDPTTPASPGTGR